MVTWIAVISIGLGWFGIYTHLLFYAMLCNHCRNGKLLWHWTIPLSKDKLRPFDTLNPFVQMSWKEYTLKRTKAGYVNANANEINGALLRKDELLEEEVANVTVMLYGKKWWRKHICQTVCWVIIHWLLWGFMSYVIVASAYFYNIWDLKFA